jgi:hypothetical protein
LTLPAGDWLDLIHHYLTERTAPEQQDLLNRSLTGPLDTWMPQPAGPPQLRPPPWSRIRPTDIARMARARQAAAEQT